MNLLELQILTNQLNNSKPNPVHISQAQDTTNQPSSKNITGQPQTAEDRERLRLYMLNLNAMFQAKNQAQNALQSNPMSLMNLGQRGQEEIMTDPIRQKISQQQYSPKDMVLRLLSKFRS